MNFAVLAPPLRILLLSAFLVLAKTGYITWLTPESAASVVNRIMDFLVVAVPAGYAAWAGFKATRAEMIKAVNARSGVLGVAVTPDVAAKIDDPTVTTPDKLPAAIRSAS